ncbi:nitroreductase family protein [Nonomuraea typhae]|uniref:Nitroreductase family protein n=1 Tax=Nonomuraea typhae TaxID=2603600 RepID=A0ABW7YUR1_9ACTN
MATELIRSFSAPDLPDEPAHRALLTRAAVGESLSFPVADPPDVALSAILRARRSTRFFDDAAVPAPVLAGVVTRGLGDDADSWAAEQDCCPLAADVVAFRVDGLAPAMYALNPLPPSFTPLASLPSDEAMREMTIQSEFCDSAAIVAITGDVERASRRHGGHGYRQLMSRAGAAAYAMWLEAIGHGLVGTVFAGFIPASVRIPLDCDGASRHQLFALAVGSPVRTTPEPAAASAARLDTP